MFDFTKITKKNIEETRVKQVKKKEVVSSKPKDSIKGEKIVKTFVQYIACHDLETNEVWMEDFRSFVAKDSFLKKRMNKKQLAARKKKKLNDSKPVRIVKEQETREEVL